MPIIVTPLSNTPVRPETVGQFTGKKVVRNEKEIYVGDLVLVRGRKRIGDYIDEVIECSQGFTLKENKTYYNNDACMIAILDIIGNIHQHPELLTPAI
jgi:hypothetical protein